MDRVIATEEREHRDLDPFVGKFGLRKHWQEIWQHVHKESFTQIW